MSVRRDPLLNEGKSCSKPSADVCVLFVLVVVFMVVNSDSDIHQNVAQIMTSSKRLGTENSHNLVGPDSRQSMLCKAIPTPGFKRGNL